MLAQRKLKPGQPRTKKLLEEYGSRLLCVRYRSAPESQSIIKTVEITVEESTRKPRQQSLKAEQLVALRIGWKEYDLQRQARQAGAKWNPADRVWESRHDQVVALGLPERIEKDRVSDIRHLKNVQYQTPGGV